MCGSPPSHQRNELDTALRHVSEGIGACRQMNFTQPRATGLATLAWIRQARGDAAGAREAMEEAGQAGPGPGVAGLLNPVPAQRARLQLAQGEVAAAARWTQERGLGPDDEPGYPREPEYLVLARVLRNKATKDLERQLREAFGDLVYQTVIPHSVRVEEAHARHRTILEWDPKSPPALAYERLVTEVLKHGRSKRNAVGADPIDGIDSDAA